MKEQIINYFRNDKSYATGVKLVIRYSLKIGLKKQVNLQEESPYLLGVIQEELRQIAGISEPTMKSMLALPIASPEVKMNIAPTDPGMDIAVEPDIQPEPKAEPISEPKSETKNIPVSKNSKPLGKPRGRKK